MVKILLSLALIFLSFTHTGIAETVHSEGVGIYYMNEDENLSKAKDKAKIYAIRSAAESISTKIIADSHTKNNLLKNDEIIAITAGILKINNVVYEINTFEDDIVEIKATVYIEADFDEINNAIKAEIERRRIKG